MYLLCESLEGRMPVRDKKSQRHRPRDELTTITGSTRVEQSGIPAAFFSALHRSCHVGELERNDRLDPQRCQILKLDLAALLSPGSPVVGWAWEPAKGRNQ